MQVCFSLVRPYAVGPVNLCLFGGGQTASGLTICGPSCGSTESCESTFYQKETVCVPVTVSPFAHPGTARTICCGDPVIHTDPQCPGSKTSCTFTVTQSLCIQIPIAFGAVIETGEVLWSSIFVTLMANKIGGLQFGIYRNCQISSRVFHTAVAALPLTKANRSDFE